MMKKVIWIGLILIHSQNWAQQKVGDKLYQTTLSVLLSHTVPEISVLEAKEVLNKTLFLDARKLEEFHVSHIENSKHIGYKDFSTDSLQRIPKNTPLIVYCSVGYRSEKIAEKLIDLGYTNVSNLYGGLFEWKNCDLETVNATQKTDSIHAYNKVWGKWITNKRAIKVYN